MNIPATFSSFKWHGTSRSPSAIAELLVSFWYWLNQVVPDKGPLNGCVCVRYAPVGTVNSVMHTHNNNKTLPTFSMLVSELECLDQSHHLINWTTNWHIINSHLTQTAFVINYEQTSEIHPHTTDRTINFMLAFSASHQSCKQCHSLTHRVCYALLDSGKQYAKICTIFNLGSDTTTNLSTVTEVHNTV